jgi:flagellar basal body rod protein FlgG
VISHNLANVSTTGFKRNNAVFEDLIYQNLRQVGANTTEQNQLPTGLHLGLGVRTVATSRNFTQGSLQETKNSLDVAINGNGFFEVTMPDGTIGYTRDGSFQVDAQGRLVTSSGLPVANGITVPQRATSISISADGVVSAIVAGNTQPQQLGNLAMSSFINPAGLEPTGPEPVQGIGRLGPAATGHARHQRAGLHQAGVSGVVQRQRGGRAGQHDPDPARLRDEFQGHPDQRPDAGQAQPALNLPCATEPHHETHRSPPLALRLGAAAGPGAPPGSGRLRQPLARAPGGRPAHHAASADRCQPRMAPQPATGSLYQQASYRPMFEDRRARMVGDMVTIQIVENMTASQKSSSTVDRSSEVRRHHGLPFVGSTFTDKTKLGAKSGNTFAGKGGTESANTFEGSITTPSSTCCPTATWWWRVKSRSA